MPHKLTSAQRKKFEAQAAHAKRIMDKAMGPDDVVIKDTTAYQAASRARQRALKMLGRGKPFPKKAGSDAHPKRKGSTPGARSVGVLAGKVAKKLSPRETVRKLGGVQERAETGGVGRPKGVDEKAYKKYFGDK